ATMTLVLLFSSQAAYTVRRSTGSTTICGSNWPDVEGAMCRGTCQVSPLSSLVTRVRIGFTHEGHPGTTPYCEYNTYTWLLASAASAGSHWSPTRYPIRACGENPEAAVAATAYTHVPSMIAASKRLR